MASDFLSFIVLSSRVRELEMSGIRKMFDAAPSDVVNLGLGEPDFDPPDSIKEALLAAVRNGYNKYGPSAGIIPLRDAIAQRYEQYSDDTLRDNVLVTIGGSEALMVTALSIYNPGDEVLVPNPGFVLYAPHARLAGAKPVFYSLREERDFLPNLTELESLVTARTKAIVVNSPNNPTGAIFSARLVDQICDFANDHDLTIVSDEVYDEIIYTDEPYSSFWGKRENVVVVNSFSKVFAMTGWRLGYLLGPRNFVVEANKIHYYMVACPSTPAQVAALRGFQSAAPHTKAMVQEFQKRRDYLIKALRTVPGMTCVMPKGAFYAFPAFSWDLSDVEAAQELLKRGLLCTPGSSFGTLGQRHLRLSYAASRKNLEKAVAILKAFGEEQR